MISLIAYACPSVSEATVNNMPRTSLHADDMVTKTTHSKDVIMFHGFYCKVFFINVMTWCLAKINQNVHQYHYDDAIMGAIGSQITSLTSVYSTVYSSADQSKHQSSASLAFVWVIHQGPVNSPHKWPVTRKMFPFDDVIMWRSPYKTKWITPTPPHFTHIRFMRFTLYE